MSTYVETKYFLNSQCNRTKKKKKKKTSVELTKNQLTDRVRDGKVVGRRLLRKRDQRHARPYDRSLCDLPL